MAKRDEWLVKELISLTFGQHDTPMVSDMSINHTSLYGKKDLIGFYFYSRPEVDGKTRSIMVHLMQDVEMRFWSGRSVRKNSVMIQFGNGETVTYGVDMFDFVSDIILTHISKIQLRKRDAIELERFESIKEAHDSLIASDDFKHVSSIMEVLVKSDDATYSTGDDNNILDGAIFQTNDVVVCLANPLNFYQRHYNFRVTVAVGDFAASYNFELEHDGFMDHPVVKIFVEAAKEISSKNKKKIQKMLID